MELRSRLLLWASLSALAAGAGGEGARAQSLDVSGSVAIEARVFTEDARFPGQSEDVDLAFKVEPEFVYEHESGARLRVVPFARLDSEDDRRSHVDLRQAYALWRRGPWEFSLGADVLFWGVTESRHLVNIVNQIDALEDVNEEALLGQPMARATLREGTQQFSFMVMTGFREREFAGREGRLRGERRISTDAEYEAEGEQWAPDIAFRYTLSSGAFDLGLSTFHGTSREPRFLDLGGETLTPWYDRITQASLDLQWTSEALALKLEALAREGQGDTFAAAVAGFEWTSPQIAGTSADLGLLAEYLYDGRGEGAPYTALDEDLFVGGRITFNDTQDTALLAGVVVDLSGGAGSLRLEFERRLGAHWTLEIAGQAFDGAAPSDPEAAFEQDDFLSVELARHF